MSAISQLNVSRETLERLELVEALLKKWNPRINLVSRSTLADSRVRHIEDSAQIWTRAPKNWKNWSDFGSGGGFPGLIIAILAHELNPDGIVTLVESDQRKCTFLRTVLRETGVSANIVMDRIENIHPLGSDVISARALADLGALLEYAVRHQNAEGCCLFPKGARWEKEVEDARKSWSFSMEQFTSETDSQAVILKIKDIAHE